MDRIRALAAAAQAAPSGFWEWASASFSVGDVVSSSGLVTIVALLYTGRLVPIGQHRRELEQQKTYYEGRLTEAREAANLATTNAESYFNARIAEVTQSRDYYRDARLEEKERADRATDQLGESLELTKTTVKVLTAIDEATNGTTP